MRWGGGTGLEVRIQAGFENDSLASWRKIPEQKSLHLTRGEDAGPWAYLLPTVFVSTVNTVHSCCAASVQAQPPVCGGVAFAKSQEKLPSAIRCGFLSLQNAEQSSTRLIFAHKHTAPSPRFFFWQCCCEGLFLQPLHYRWGISQPLLRQQGWMVSTPRLKKRARLPWGRGRRKAWGQLPPLAGDSDTPTCSLVAPSQGLHCVDLNPAYR